MVVEHPYQVVDDHPRQVFGNRPFEGTHTRTKVDLTIVVDLENDQTNRRGLRNLHPLHCEVYTKVVYPKSTQRI